MSTPQVIDVANELEFNQAIAKDSNYAQAYSGVADAYIILLDRGWIPTGEASPKIRSAAQRAIELDPASADVIARHKGKLKPQARLSPRSTPF